MDPRNPPSSSPPGRDASPAVVRRRWEAVLPREEIASLLAESRLQDLLARLGDARARWPRDLELLRSIRVIEDHLKSRAGSA
jgi:hypothetical protein